MILYNISMFPSSKYLLYLGSVEGSKYYSYNILIYNDIFCARKSKDIASLMKLRSTLNFSNVQPYTIVCTLDAFIKY